MIVKKTVYLYLREHTLPEICMALHMALSGAGDPWDDEAERVAARYLRIRVARWRPSAGPLWREFDQCVKKLCEATVAEYEVRSRLRAENAEALARLDSQRSLPQDAPSGRPFRAR